MSGSDPTISPAASPAQAAAIVAALDRFLRESAQRRGRGEEAPDPWRRAAILEGVSRADLAPPGWGG